MQEVLCLEIHPYEKSAPKRCTIYFDEQKNPTQSRAHTDPSVSEKVGSFIF